MFKDKELIKLESELEKLNIEYLEIPYKDFYDKTDNDFKQEESLQEKIRDLEHEILWFEFHKTMKKVRLECEKSLRIDKLHREKDAIMRKHFRT